MVQINKTAGRLLGAIFFVCTLSGCDGDCGPALEGRDYAYKRDLFSITFNFTAPNVDDFYRAEILTDPVRDKIVKSWCSDGVLPTHLEKIEKPLFWRP